MATSTRSGRPTARGLQKAASRSRDIRDEAPSRQAPGRLERPRTSKDRFVTSTEGHESAASLNLHEGGHRRSARKQSSANDGFWPRARVVMTVHGRPRFAMRSFSRWHEGADCTRTSGLCVRHRAAVPDGIGWLAPDRYDALAVQQSFWVWPTKV